MKTYADLAFLCALLVAGLYTYNVLRAAALLRKYDPKLWRKLGSYSSGNFLSRGAGDAVARYILFTNNCRTLCDHELDVMVVRVRILFWLMIGSFGCGSIMWISASS